MSAREPLEQLSDKVTLLLFGLDGVTAVLEEGSGEEIALRALYEELVNVGVRVRGISNDLPAVDLYDRHDLAKAS